jgi:plastocyanin
MSARPARRALRPALVLAALLIGLVPAHADAATVTVSIDEGLSPRTITIAPGTTVRWANESDNRYRMRSRNGPEEFDSGNIEPGESFSFTFTKVGTYPYLDDRDRGDADFHGTVTVAAAAPPATTPPDGGTAPPAPGAPAAATVGMAGRTFSPGAVTIAAGGSVTFVNDDDREHTATGSAFDTGILDPGARSTERFPSAGTFTFLCQIHPDMRGTVTVRGASGTAPPPPAATPRPTPTPTPTPAPTGAAGSTDSSVAIVDFSFEAAELEVPASTTVTWTNQGVAPHTVTAGDGSFESGRLAPGGAFSRRFDAPGRFAYACAFHPGMVGSVVVTAPTGSAPPSAAASPETSASPSGGGGAGVAGGPPADVAAVPATRPVTAQLADGFLRLLLVAVIVAGAVVAFGVLVVSSARPGGARRPR